MGISLARQRMPDAAVSWVAKRTAGLVDVATPPPMVPNSLPAVTTTAVVAALVTDSWCPRSSVKETRTLMVLPTSAARSV